jgi:hypothetical protein
MRSTDNPQLSALRSKVRSSSSANGGDHSHAPPGHKTTAIVRGCVLSLAVFLKEPFPALYPSTRYSRCGCGIDIVVHRQYHGHACQTLGEWMNRGQCRLTASWL